MSDQVNKSTIKPDSLVHDRKPRSILRIFAWMLLALLLGAVILAVIIWINRYSLIENQARKTLSDAGITAEFDIEKIDRTEAIINNMRFSDEDGPFFSSEKLVLKYRFEQVRAGIVDKITLKDPVLRLTLDGSGNVIDRWVPESSEETEPFIFPKDGIFLENGRVDWAAPWGAGATGISAQIQSETRWQSQIDMQSARYADDDIEFDYSYAGNINRLSEYELDIDGLVKFPSARVRQSRFGPVNSEIDIKLSSAAGSEEINIDADLDLSVSAGIFQFFAMGYSEIDTDIDAKYNIEAGEFQSLNADWALNSSELSVTDDALRSRLVRQTLAYNALQKTPIAMHFADEIERNGNRILKQFSAKGSGTYAYDPTGYEINFDAPLILKSAAQNATLKPKSGPEVKFNAAQQTIDLSMDVDWRNSRNLILQDLQMKGRSENGVVLKNIDQVSANIKSRDTWRRTVKGETFRLAPLNMKMNYVNSQSGGRVTIGGGIDYDGALPGGQVEKLKTDGKVVINTNGLNFAMSYQPSGKIEMSEFVSKTGWRAKNLSFELVDGKDVLRRTRNTQPFHAVVKNVRADVASPEDDRHLKTYFDTMEISSDFQTKPQIWQLNVGGIAMQSDDFPSPGTDIRANSGTALFTQYGDGSVEFVVTSPETTIVTDNVNVENLFIEMSGRPDDFSAVYQAGSVQLKGGDIPVVPMEGTARLKDGILTGAAVAPMPKTRNTPININYRSEEGIGSMQISIPKVVFTPRGLQPQYLIPTLKGKLAEVSGEAAAEFEFAFGKGEPVRSFGTTTLKNMDIGTLVGPASGVSAELNFKSMFPLETDGVQTATMAVFDAGFPLENGTIKFEMVPNGVRIDQALWPVKSPDHGDGKIFLSPMLWQFGNVENNAVVNVENLSLGKILEDIGNQSLTATGQISGQLPATIKGVDVEINNGRLAIEHGGVIRYRNQGIDTFAKDAKQPYYLGDEFAGSETGFAFKALENFQYKELEALINGPLDGEMTLRMLFGGKNPDLLAGTAFEFDVAVSGELANIARDSIGALDAQKHLDAIVDMQRDADKKAEK